MYSIAVCDDDKKMWMTIDALLESNLSEGAYTTRHFSDSGSLKAAVDSGYWPDIAIIDIVLGADSGIDMVKRLFMPERGTQVIYLTGYGEYCTDVYETNHIYFLLKPVENEKFRLAVEKAVHNLETADSGSFLIKQKAGVVRMLFRHILYIESSGRKITVYTDDGDYELYQTLPEAQKSLPDYFVCSHKSFLVNMNRIALMESDAFVLDTGVSVPISQRRSPEAKTQFLRYIGERL